MEPELTKHIIAARSIFFGTSYFLILSLPKGWAITRSYLEPDVHSSVQRENITWVEAGQTDQLLFHPGRKVALDLMIRIQRGRHESLDSKGVQIFSSGLLSVMGHPGSYFIGEVKQGLLRKKTARTLRLTFYCPELDHTLFLHVTGQCTDADLKEIHQFLPFLECH